MKNYTHKQLQDCMDIYRKPTNIELFIGCLIMMMPLVFIMITYFV